MPFLDTGRTAVRNFLAGSSPTAPTTMLWGTSSDSVNQTDSTISAVDFSDSFVSVDSSVDREVQWEGIILSTEATTSSFTQVAIGTETTGTAGTLYLKEGFATVVKNNTFDLQTLVISDVTREDGT